MSKTVAIIAFLYLIGILNIVTSEDEKERAANEACKNAPKSKGENVPESNFWTMHFFRIKQNYDRVCNQTVKDKNGNEKPTVIDYDTTKKLLDKCVVPELKELKRNFSAELGKMYPDLWDDVISHCFRGKIQNFCKRAKDGEKEKSNDRSIDNQVYCAGARAFAFHADLKRLYCLHVDIVKSVSLREKECIDAFFVNIEKNRGVYIE